MPLTYASYLKVKKLLSLQQPVSAGPEHDETLFIIIHHLYQFSYFIQFHRSPVSE